MRAIRPRKLKESFLARFAVLAQMFIICASAAISALYLIAPRATSAALTFLPFAAALGGVVAAVFGALWLLKKAARALRRKKSRARIREAYLRDLARVRAFYVPAPPAPFTLPETGAPAEEEELPPDASDTIETVAPAPAVAPADTLDTVEKPADEETPAPPPDAAPAVETVETPAPAPAVAPIETPADDAEPEKPPDDADEETVPSVDIEDAPAEAGLRAAMVLKNAPRWLEWQVRRWWQSVLIPFCILRDILLYPVLHPAQIYAKTCRVTARRVAQQMQRAAAAAGFVHVLAARETNERKRAQIQRVTFKNSFATADEIWLHVDPERAPRGHQIAELAQADMLDHMQSAVGHPIRVERGALHEFFLVVSMTGIGGIPTRYAFKDALEVAKHERAERKREIFLFCAGAGANGIPYCLTLDGMWSNMFLVGPTGRGKTRLMFAILLQHCYLNAPRDLQIYLIDLKMTSFHAYHFDSLPHLAPRFRQRKRDKIPGQKESKIHSDIWKTESGEDAAGTLPSVATTEVQALLLLRHVFGEMQSRKKKFQLARVESLEKWNRLFPSARMAHIELVIDEIADLMTASKYKQEARELLRRIASQCRVFGIRVLTGTQIASKEIIQIAIKVNFWFVCFYTESGIVSNMVLSSWAATKLPPNLPGRYLAAANRSMELQAPYADDHEIRNIVEEIKTMYKREIYVHEEDDVEDEDAIDDATEDVATVVVTTTTTTTTENAVETIATADEKRAREMRARGLSISAIAREIFGYDNKKSCDKVRELL